jgi:hydroxyacylglutathione hydrolase
VTVRELAAGLGAVHSAVGWTLNSYLLDDVLLDSGVVWTGPWLAWQLGGRRLSAHALTHAHADHGGPAAALCRSRGIPLWVGEGDAAAMRSGDVRSHGSGMVNAVVRVALPTPAAPVDRGLREGDEVGGFTVLEVPGHSPGSLAFWREADRVLLCGDALTNMTLLPSRPRVRQLPHLLCNDAEATRTSAQRLAAFRPRLACFGHGPPLKDPGAFAEGVARLLD